MLPNTSCTLYLTEDKKAYKRVYCPNVHWEDTKGKNFSKTGVKDVDSVKVWIPLAGAVLDNQTGYVVRGSCPFAPSDEHPIRELITQGIAYTITSIARFDFGSSFMQHWEVYAK